MPGTIDIANEKDTYLSHFERLNQQSGQSIKLKPVREAAFARFRELGFPTTRHEEWRHTNVAPIAKATFAPAPRDGQHVGPNDLSPYTFGGSKVSLAVFVNGRFAPDLSSLSPLTAGVQVVSLGAAIEAGSGVVERHLGRYLDYEDQAFAALNTALMEDGALIHIRKDTVVEQPIHLLFVSTTKGPQQVTHPRNLIVAEANSQATIVESYVGLDDDVYFTNAVTEVVAGENAVLDHYKIERESAGAFHIAVLRIHQERNSNVTSLAVSLGGALVRNDIHAVLDGEGCECSLNGLYMITGSQHVDNHLLVEHAKPHCDSRENFKGILDQNSRGVFSGRIIVRRDAQKTDAKQSNMTLLLSKGAQVESKPQLEIFADDVKCTHGATIGQVSEEAIFYLRSRGISEEAARSLLVYAFAHERVEQIRIDALRTQLEGLLFAQLRQGELLQEAL